MYFNKLRPPQTINFLSTPSLGLIFFYFPYLFLTIFLLFYFIFVWLFKIEPVDNDPDAEADLTPVKVPRVFFFFLSFPFSFLINFFNLLSEKNFHESYKPKLLSSKNFNWISTIYCSVSSNDGSTIFFFWIKMIIK